MPHPTIRTRIASAAIACSAMALPTLAQPARAPTTDRGTASQPYDYFQGLRFDPAIPPPSRTLGHDIGQQFSRHHQVVDYCKALANASDRVDIEFYGSSVQGRDLLILTISSPDNLARLDDILASNRRLAQIRDLPGSTAPAAPEVDAIIAKNPAVVWLSYNVHGNEPSPTECAMQLAYTLAAASNAEIRTILDNLVIVIDPCLNPDGRDRYVNWLRDQLGSAPDAHTAAIERDEPWPGGRVNHYLFDLNRDWVWLVQPESRARLPVYRRYLPQLHVDYHEQGHHSPYFFGAGDDPYNQHIPQESRQWFERYGLANARVFDDRAIMYSTRERFDYLYPGYGKVLPCYHGAVGLLCEKAGHSAAGLAIRLSEQYTLTLQDRVRDHFLTSMSYIESTAAWRKDQLVRFRRFFQGSVDAARGPQPVGPTAIAIDPTNDPALLQRLWDFCSAQGIEVNELGQPLANADLFLDYATATPDASNAPIEAGTWIIRADQEMGHLVRAMFERATHVSDPRTYDITGWSIPISFGLRARYSIEPLDRALASNADGTAQATLRVLTTFEPEGAQLTGARSIRDAVALVVESAQANFPRALGVLATQHIDARLLGEPVTIDGSLFQPGSIMIPKMLNPKRDLDALLASLAGAGISVHLASTALSDDGPVLGADAHPALVHPRILLVGGPGTSANSFGQHWHLLDVAHPIPHTRTTASTLVGDALDDFTVLVLPDGAALSAAATERVKAWMRAGGTVVASGSSAGWASRTLLEVKESLPGKSDDDRKRASDSEQPNSARTFKERKDRGPLARISGAMLRVAVDATHPLSCGVPAEIGVIARASTTAPADREGYAIARFIADDQGNAQPIGGQAGDDALRSIGPGALCTHHRVGRGNLICFSEDLTIRGFHHAGTRLLLNAITLGPTVGRF